MVILLKRKIYEKLLEWKNNNINKPLMVIGARQVGKTYIIQKFCNKEFKEYIYINLLEYQDIIEIFSRKISIVDKIELLKIIIKDKQNIDFDPEKMVIFFDEIQESEELISCLKYFNEAKENYKIICAGSLLGVKLNRMKSSFPVGKVKMLELNPMDFEEYIVEIMGENIVTILKNCYDKNEPLVEPMHDKLLSLYRNYLCIGGMPESVSNYININKEIIKFDKSIIEDIIKGYTKDMKKYVQDNTETVRIENIYNSIPSQIGNKSGKFQYAKINKDARSKNYETALNWLLSSKLVDRVCLLNSVQIPPKAYENTDYFKLFLSDVGILTSLLKINFADIILDKEFIFKGEIAENYVEQQLRNNVEQLYYWKSENTAEVDFVIYNNDGLIPIEVKAGDSVKSKSLYVYNKRFKPKYSIRVSAKNFGFANNIKSIPLYAAFLIN